LPPLPSSVPLFAVNGLVLGHSKFVFRSADVFPLVQRNKICIMGVFAGHEAHARSQRQQRRRDDATNPKGKIMRTSFGSILGLSLAFVATPAFADDTAPPSAITINGGATLVSDYRFRGISQTDKKPAIQGSLTVTHESGFYASIWGSSVDDYVTASTQAHQEIDLIAGFKKTFSGTTVDVGAVYYVYPKTKLAGDKSTSDFIEPYLAISHTLGPVTAKATVNWAPKQKALALDQIKPKLDNFYLAGDLSAAIPNTPLTLTGHLGHTWGPSWLSIGKAYTDWGVGASVTFKSLSLGAQYVGSNGVFLTPTGKKANKGGLVATLGVSF
jgi:uncharacterized protein (TIGR02001 family)